MSKAMKKIGIMEVCPRDGWQNLVSYISFEKKLEYISDMLGAGIRDMEVTAFVSPKAVPQMKDAADISRAVLERFPDRNFCALVPNMRGAQNAANAGIKEVSYVISVSESHNKANVNRTHKESFAELGEIREKIPGIRVVPALCTVFGCPFEGKQPVEKVMSFIRHTVTMGFDTIELADTIGTGNPVLVSEIFAAAKKEHPNVTFMAHMHDTRNNGILNSWVAVTNGADIVHTSLGGLGGCPFAPGASGNTCTEDFVWLLEESGIDTGINFKKIRAASKKMFGEVKGCYSGHHVAIEEDVFEKACDLKY
jgi:hydroxymethylglutaryl-CoA lyase